jgi:hypothetical protein
MERCFSVEAKRFSFSAKAEVPKLRLEERRKGFYGFIALGHQGSAWLLASVEEALKVSAKEFVKYFREDVKVLMVRGGENKSGCYLEVEVFAEGGRKAAIWLPEGREGWGWARVAGVLRKMINFLGPKDRTMGSEAFSLEGTQIRGVSSSQLGGSPPTYAAVVRGEVVSHGTHAGLRGSDGELRGLDLFPVSWCRVVEDGRSAVNCFDLEEQPHGSTEKSTPPVWSGSSSFDPLDKCLPRRPLGKKKHVVYSARGPSRLNSNLHTWTRMLLSFKLALGRALGNLLGRFAGSGSGLKWKGLRLGCFLPKIKTKASFQTETSEDAGPVLTVVLGCSLQPKTTSPIDSGLIPGLSSAGGGPNCQKLFPARDVGMGWTEIQPEISSGTESGVVLGLSSSGSVSSHLPLVPAVESVTLPSPTASFLLSSNSVLVLG